MALHRGLAGLILVGAVVGALALGRGRVAAPPARVAPTVHSPAEIRDLDIAFYQTRVKRDPYGARDLAMLGALYLARARETGSYSDILRAEEAARSSYGHRSNRNGGAAAVLASSLLAQHRFVEAYGVAKSLVALDSTEASTRAMLGEIALELGRYLEADTLFKNLSTERYAPALAPRYARWLELHGQGVEAIQLLRSVRQTLSNGFRVPPEQLAWFDLRIGDLAFRAGDLAQAEKAFAAGLTEAPEDYRLLGAEARLHAARHEWQPAIQAGERAVASVLDPATLGLLSDCYLASGDSTKADEYAKAMEVSVSQQPGAFHRAWSLFLLDHNRDVSQVRRKAMEELRTRRDVYGYDLAAWALHKSGEDRQAEQLAVDALQLGTRDAMLYFHAGVIAYARGQNESARERLSQALEINPYFHPTQADEARQILRTMGRQPSAISLNR